MSEFSAVDHEMMARALRLARRGMFSAHPNPRVGCILVRDGQVVGEGWHRKTGEAHAEIDALGNAGSAAKGSTAYVTLEPCSHHGKTPPCADALVEAEVATVIVAMEDPHPKVAGSGLEILRGAGIEVRTGLMRESAAELNEGFICRVSCGRPFVRIKIAASLDGRTAMKSGESQWITGEDARRDVQRLRASSGAIMTGIATVMDDDPSLTLRDEFFHKAASQPLRVVLDSKLRMPATARMLGLPGTTNIFCAEDRQRGPLENAGAIVTKVAAMEGRTDPVAVLKNLAEQDINDVLVEAGPTLAGALMTAGLADELVIYQAPHIMGSETRGMVDTPSWQELGQRMVLDIVGVRKIGQDAKITARPAK